MKSVSDQLWEALICSPEPTKQIEALEKIPQQQQRWKDQAEQERQRIMGEFYD